MKNKWFLLLLLPIVGHAHPGIGIIKDSKGNIYYSDLKHVWRLTNGERTIVVRDVHTHELHIDQHDNIYGEDGYYDATANIFYHYLWVFRPSGTIDTVIGMREAYIHHDFAISRDEQGNEFYLKRFIVPHSDTNHIYRRTPEGKETVFATGHFKDVNWLHPQDDGSVLYVSNNTIYKINTSGKSRAIAKNISTRNSLGKSPHDPMIWGVWTDDEKNIYAAVTSDQTVIRIDTMGTMTDVYTSEGTWGPLHGVLDEDNNMWILENSDKNVVRVKLVKNVNGIKDRSNRLDPHSMLSIILFCILLMLF